MSKFSKGEAIGFGWQTMKHNLGFFIILLIIVGLFYSVPDIIAGMLSEVVPFLSMLIYIISWVLAIVIQMGLIRIGIKFCDNEKVVYDDLFSCFSLFFRYLGGSILYALIILGGFILLIIPGIIWGIKFQFYSYFIVDKGLGPLESLKRSAEITRGAKWDLFIFEIVLLLINIVGFICLVIGLFATIPTTLVAMAFVYRTLLVQVEGIDDPDTAEKELDRDGRESFYSMKL